MGLKVPEYIIRSARLEEGEMMIGLNARQGEEYDLQKLAEAVRAELWKNGESLNVAKPEQFEVLHCGWWERPAPDMVEGVHAGPLGKLWVIYRKKIVPSPDAVAEETEDS